MLFVHVAAAAGVYVCEHMHALKPCHVVMPGSTAVHIYPYAYVTVGSFFSRLWVYKPHTYASKDLSVFS